MPATHRKEPARPIRVLQLTSVSAANYLLNNLVDYSDPCEVTFAAATLAGRSPFVFELEKRGVATFPVGAPSRLHYPRVLRDLSAIIESQRIDLMHAHLFEPSLLGAMAAARRRIPLIITRHHSDAIHRLRSLPRRYLYRTLEAWISQRAARIIAPARMVRDVMIGKEGVPPSRIVIVPYPQAPGRFDAVTPECVRETRKSLAMEGQTALVYVARLHPEKGHEVLFDALKRLLPEFPAIRVYLVGAGDHGPVLEAAAFRAGLAPHVTFLGWRDDALMIVGAADVVVHPSLHEALPSAVIEALVLRRPVVASDVSGVRDILGDGEFGTIAPPGDANALCVAIANTIRDLPAARRRAQAGRDVVLDYMEPGRVARAHLDCYRQALDGPSGTGEPPDSPP